MALVGEEHDESDEICGAVVSLRSKVDRIQLWTRSKDEVEKMNSIWRKFIKLFDVSEADGIGLEFQVSAPPFRTPYKPIDPMYLVQYGGSPASEQVPLDQGRSLGFIPPYIPQQPDRQSGLWSRPQPFSRKRSARAVCSQVSGSMAA